MEHTTITTHDFPLPLLSQDRFSVSQPHGSIASAWECITNITASRLCTTLSLLFWIISPFPRFSPFLSLFLVFSACTVFSLFVLLIGWNEMHTYDTRRFYSGGGGGFSRQLERTGFLVASFSLSDLDSGVCLSVLELLFCFLFSLLSLFRVMVWSFPRFFFVFGLWLDVGMCNGCLDSLLIYV